MSTATAGLAAGVTGALTTTVLHEVTRHAVPNAPRVDLLGMQGIARAFGKRGPKGKNLFALTLAADICSNAAYYSLVAVSRRNAARVGLVLGLAAGIGAVVLPGPLRFDTKTTSRTPLTALLSVALYTAGGLAAGVMYDSLGDNGSHDEPASS